MKSDDIKKLAEDPHHIPGIYNYCDRWCERCTFTSRCLNFKMSEEKFEDPQTRDVQSAAFWEKLDEIFQETTSMLREMAEERGIDLDSICLEEDAEDRSVRDETNSVVHMLLHIAKSYIANVDHWFEPYVDLAELNWDEGSNLESTPTPSEADRVTFRDSVEVIRWYQHQIYVKLKRALNSAQEEKSRNTDDFPKDSDGSAKVALIGIDRSISAWVNILTVFPDQEEETQAIIALLVRLRKIVENEFPAARAFLRPGFDSD